MAANTISILIKATDQASKTIRGVGKEVDDNASRLARYKSAALLAGGTAATTLATGIIAASKAAFDQVKAVEEARYGLLAYEKDGKKVDKVLGDLVSYAKSDMGVLFNRADLFAAASTLKMYGNETDTLTDRVKILSKGVAMGKTTFQELSQIVGRAAAKGRLDAVDFDMLIERGIGLDRRFRGAKVSADELWKALNTALPDKLLAGRAKTIEGRFIRLQTAFRQVGNEILGVDAKTNNFIRGGLGDTFMRGVESATSALREVPGVLQATSSAFEQNRQLLISLAAGYVAYRASTGAATVATTALAAAQGTLNAVMRVSPIGLLIGASAALVTAYIGVVSQSDRATTASDRLRMARENLAQKTRDAKRAEDELKNAQLTAEEAALRVERAQRSYTEAVRQYGPKSLEAREAELQLKRARQDNAAATNDLKNKTNAAAAANRDLAKGKDMVVAANNSMKNSAYQAAGGFQAFASAARDAQKAASSGNTAKSNQILNDSLKINLGGKHASGTPYAPGGLALVGERGPELVELPRGSRVNQAYRTRQMASEGAALTIQENGNYYFYNQDQWNAHQERRNQTARLASWGMAS